MQGTHTETPPLAHFGRWIAFFRIAIGLFWLYEVFLGLNWKVGNPEWVGSGAGHAILADGKLAIEAGTWPWFTWVLENVFYPFAPALSYLTIALQILVGLSLVFGFMTRPAIIISLGMEFSIYMLGNSRIPPFFTAAELFLLFTHASAYYGIDGVLARGVKPGSLSYWAIGDVNLSEKIRTVLGSAALLAAAYYLMKILTLKPKMQAVSMELAVMLGLVAYGLFTSTRTKNYMTLATDVLRLFVAYKFLSGIWSQAAPGLNSLPGWSTDAQLAKLFQTIVAKHWPVMSSVVEGAFLSAPATWALVFGIVQMAVGLMLFFNYKAKQASQVGLVFLGVLVVIGFTRFTPFVFAYLLAVAGFEAVKAAPLPRRSDLTPSVTPAVALIGLAVVAVGAALSSGVSPNGYQSTMGGVTAAMVALLSLAAGAAGILDYYLHTAETSSVKQMEKPASVA